MNCRAQETASRKRTSERMRLKMLRNLDQYKILNPYRQPHNSIIPDDMQRQLKKLTHLSSTSIQLLSLQNQSTQPFHAQGNLQRMRQAHQEQENRFRTVFGDSMLDEGQLVEESYCHSEAHPTHPSQGSDILQNKQLLPLSLYEDRSHLHDHLFESKQPQEELEDMREEQPGSPPQEIGSFLDEDYQKYFLN